MSNYDNQKSLAEMHISNFEWDKAADALEKSIPMLDEPDANFSEPQKRLLRQSIRARIELLRPAT